ncbi:MAG TPA: EAL domain-containing protein [Acidimicrobiales bacterium]|nr:EAL domain-containing protein [Acidimicrobiales bacterium]
MAMGRPEGLATAGPIARHDQLDDLQRAERVMQLTRWVAVVFAAVQVLTYKTLPYPDGFQRTGLVLIAMLAVANLVLAVASRATTTVRAGLLVAGVGLAVDVAVASGFVWLYTFDTSTAIWAVLYILPLEGAIRFGLGGALNTWLATTALYVAREVWGSGHYGYRLATESITFRMGVLLLISLVAGMMARDLMRQRTLAEAAGHRYAGLVEGLDAIIWESDPGTQGFTFVSKEAERLLGYPVEDWLTMPDFWSKHLHPEDAERVIQHADARVAAGHDYEHEYRMIAADGRSVWLHDAAKVERDEGRPVRLRGIMVDVTEHKQAESALRESEQRFRSAFNGAGTGMALVGVDGRFLRVNHELVRLTGYTEEELLASSFLGITHPDDQAAGRMLIRRMLAGAQRSFLYEKRYLHKSGGLIWVLVSASLVSDDEDRPLYFIAQVQDITERKRAEELLEHQALHDPLTGLPNRTLLLDRLSMAIGRCKRSGASAAVLFLDLDRFKLVNDSLGHDAGDALLVAVARRLQSVLRPQDTAARFGGDEFVIVCEDVGQPEDATRIAGRINDLLSAPFALPEGETFLTASIGIALSGSHDDDSPESLLRDADSAMYRAKELGKARAELFDQHLRERANTRLSLANSLHRAQEREEFRLLYQPIVDLRSGRYVAAEALLRWDQPGRGLVPPSEFIPLAEETGLIVPIGLWSLRAAAAQAIAWRSELGVEQPVAVSVNLAARQLLHPELPKLLETILIDTGLDPSLLHLEITESALLDDSGTGMAALASLRRLGVSLHVDDFGTGYSSLSYLRRFRVDALKIDSSFVDGLGRSSEDTEIVGAIISMARALGLKTIAEGVETAQQLAELQRLGCDQAQGFYLAMPQEGETLAPILRRGPVMVDLTAKVTPGRS